MLYSLSVDISWHHPFLPKASFGLWVLSLPASVRGFINHELVCAITHHKFALELPNLDQTMQDMLLKVRIDFGAVWDWLSRSNLTLFQNSVYLHRFCVFEIFVRCVCWTVPHAIYSAHIWFLHARRQSRTMDCETKLAGMWNILGTSSLPSLD